MICRARSCAHHHRPAGACVTFVRTRPGVRRSLRHVVDRGVRPRPGRHHLRRARLTAPRAAAPGPQHTPRAPHARTLAPWQRSHTESLSDPAHEACDTVKHVTPAAAADTRATCLAWSFVVACAMSACAGPRSPGKAKDNLVVVPRARLWVGLQARFAGPGRQTDLLDLGSVRRRCRARRRRGLSRGPPTGRRGRARLDRTHIQVRRTCTGYRGPVVSVRFANCQIKFNYKRFDQL